jgi:hypothetical protein
VAAGKKGFEFHGEPLKFGFMAFTTQDETLRNGGLSRAVPGVIA